MSRVELHELRPRCVQRNKCATSIVCESAFLCVCCCTTRVLHGTCFGKFQVSRAIFMRVPPTCFSASIVIHVRQCPVRHLCVHTRRRSPARYIRMYESRARAHNYVVRDCVYPMRSNIDAASRHRRQSHTHTHTLSPIRVNR